MYTYRKPKNKNSYNGITNGFLEKMYQFNENKLYWGLYFRKKIV